MAQFEFDKGTGKEKVFGELAGYLASLSLDVVSVDNERPWGGFFVIDETDINNFIDVYFPDLPATSLPEEAKLSPKLLVVEPNKRLSWQYHKRRAELWRVVSGPIGVITSPNDVQGEVEEVATDQLVQFDALIRHRLIGLDNWGVVAEIWQHTDPANPSNEDDIIRVEDDFGRES